MQRDISHRQLFLEALGERLALSTLDGSPTDINSDGTVSPSDALVVANAINDGSTAQTDPTTDVTQDVTQDGTINKSDFDAVLAAMATTSSSDPADSPPADSPPAEVAPSDQTSSDPSDPSASTSSDPAPSDPAPTDPPPLNPTNTDPTDPNGQTPPTGEGAPIPTITLIDPSDPNNDFSAYGTGNPTPESEVTIMSLMLDRAIYELSQSGVSLGQGFIGARLGTGPSCDAVHDALKSIITDLYNVNLQSHNLVFDNYDFASVQADGIAGYIPTPWGPLGSTQHIYIGIVDRTTGQLVYFADPWRSNDYNTLNPEGGDPNLNIASITPWFSNAPGIAPPPVNPDSPTTIPGNGQLDNGWPDTGLYGGI
jgi:hypothetical protein